MNAIRNFLFLGLIVACVPAEAAPLQEKSKGPYCKLRDSVKGLLVVDGPVSKDFDLNYLLKAAVYENMPELVMNLISRGADINHQGEKDGVSPLMIAVRRGNLEMIRLLLKNGASINAKDKHNFTVFHYAVSPLDTHLDVINEEEKIKVIELLCQYCSDKKLMNGQDVGGITPLGYAYWYDHKKIQKILKKHGARRALREWIPLLNIFSIFSANFLWRMQGYHTHFILYQNQWIQ